MKRSHLQSQNYIRRPQLVKTLIGHSGLKKSDTVYDIGAGSGIISATLSPYIQRVIAIESDQRIIPKLKQNIAGLENVEVIAGDFLTMNLPDSNYKVFANIPFHLSSPIIRKLLEAPTQPTAIYLIVQKQFAKKLIVGDATSFTGLLGAFMTPWFESRIRYKLERTDFTPSPAVDTAMIELLKRDKPLIDRKDMANYQAFVEKCYSRQKYFASIPTEYTKNKRPSQLIADEWVTLYSAFKSK